VTIIGIPRIPCYSTVATISAFWNHDPPTSCLSRQNTTMPELHASRAQILHLPYIKKISIQNGLFTELFKVQEYVKFLPSCRLTAAQKQSDCNVAAESEKEFLLQYSYMPITSFASWRVSHNFIITLKRNKQGKRNSSCVLTDD
jgi:hypothetical protein